MKSQTEHPTKGVFGVGVRQLRKCQQTLVPQPSSGSRLSTLDPVCSRRGMVLILVMIIVVMVSLAGFSFVAVMHNEDKATRVRGDEIQAEQLVESAAEMVQVMMSASDTGVGSATANTLGDPAELFRGVSVFQDSTGASGRFTLVVPQWEGGEITGYRYGLENESAKLNLSALLEWERRQPESARNALLQLPGMTEAVADALLDWIDEDSSTRAFGAETEHYELLDPPYAPRNGPCESLEELLLVRGVNRRLLYGGDENRNWQLEPEELARLQNAESGAVGDDSRSFQPWSACLTAYSAERNVTPEGQPRIDLNQSTLTRLLAQLRQSVGVDVANFVVAYRQYGPSTGGAVALPAAALGLDMTVPARYRLVSPLDIVSAQVTIRKGGESAPQTVASPLSEDRNDFRERLLQLFDYTTALPSPMFVGRININVAPPPVLRAIPDLDAGLVDRIVSARGRGEEVPDPQRRHPVWLLFERIVDLAGMKSLMPYVTCGGDVYRTQIVGFFDGGGPTARVEAVFDATQDPPRLLGWKDLRVLGRGYSSETLGAVDSVRGVSPSTVPMEPMNNSPPL